MKEHPFIILETVTSTNDYAIRKLARGDLPDGTVIVANEQTAGRGRDGNSWESEPGKNLTFSMVIYPDYLKPDQQFNLTKAFSLGVFKVLKNYLGEGSTIKWPNDLYFNLGKVAGILIQNGIQGNSFSYCVAGIGLNVNQLKFPDHIPNPISMKLITGKGHDLHDLMNDVYQGIMSYLEMLRKGSMDTIDREYLSVLFRFDEEADYIYQGNRIKGKINGVEQYGHPILEEQTKELIKCDFKEVEFIL